LNLGPFKTLNFYANHQATKVTTVTNIENKSNNKYTYMIYISTMITEHLKMGIVSTPRTLGVSNVIQTIDMSNAIAEE